jgi:hypothetical protein
MDDTDIPKASVQRIVKSAVAILFGTNPAAPRWNTAGKGYKNRVSSRWWFIRVTFNFLVIINYINRKSANDIAICEGKKVVGAEHIFKALEELEFHQNFGDKLKLAFETVPKSAYEGK